jgi:formamidopyrimidine-DNA glycosylase
VPELPEVQTVVNTLQFIKNKKIIFFQNYWEKILFSKNYTYLDQTIENQVIISIERIGKYIIIKLKNNYLAFHLRMTGYLYGSKKLNKNKHVQCYFKFDDNSYLVYEDIRKFGGFYYLKDLDIINNKLGIDPYNKNFTANWLINNLDTKKRQMKALLLDQKFISGLGNIYVDEILWKSKIHPLKISNKLNQKSITNLFNSILPILDESIKFHGTTIINFKFDNMKTGNYRTKLNVYGRSGKQCNKCNSTIIKIRVAGRGTYICEKCQS